MPTEFIVAVFPSRGILTRALDHLTQMEALPIVHAAIVAKARDGEIVVLGDELSANEGGVAGGTLGAAVTALGVAQLGALALPGIGPIIALGTGALIGGLVGGVAGRFAVNLLDAGFKQEQIQILADRLQTGKPALVLELDDAYNMLEMLREELASFRVETIERVPMLTPVF